MTPLTGVIIALIVSCSANMWMVIAWDMAQCRARRYKKWANRMEADRDMFRKRWMDLRARVVSGN